MKCIKVILRVFLSVIALALVFFGILTFTEFSPEHEEKVQAVNGTSLALKKDSVLKIISWNTGYGCLGKNADFFMDGGKSVNTATKEESLVNMEEISSFMKSQDADFIFLQEVDSASWRSSGLNQTAFYAGQFKERESAYALNFKTLFIPYPLPPIGKVESGIMTLSRYSASSHTRISLPCPFPYPVRLCNLKRCLLVSRIPLEGSSRELVLVNLHLEAYDDGKGKQEQTRALLDVLKAEADKGNYVIAGGDFNQTFSETDSQEESQPGVWMPGRLDREAFTEFNLVMDEKNPSCRSLQKPYDGSDSFIFYKIDGFILSENIECLSLEARNLQFEHTDHNPVIMEFKLK